jgi:N-methylhydantoinase A
LGFLASPARADRSWSRVARIEDYDQSELTARVAVQRGAISADLLKAGVRHENIEWRFSAEMRYLGQGAAVEVDLSAFEPAELSPVVLRGAFEATYAGLFGRLVPGGIPELVTWRLAGTSRRHQRLYAFKNRTPSSLDEARMGQRLIYVPIQNAYAQVPVYERYKLPFGTVITGPVVLVEPESTLIVAQPAKVTVLHSGTVEVLLDKQT